MPPSFPITLLANKIELFIFIRSPLSPSAYRFKGSTPTVIYTINNIIEMPFSFIPSIIFFIYFYLHSFYKTLFKILYFTLYSIQTKSSGNLSFAETTPINPASPSPSKYSLESFIVYDGLPE